MSRADLPRVVHIDRADFLDNYWDYNAGEHVTFLAPNGWGKTVWTFELLRRTATPKLPAYVLATKPKDREVTRYTKELGYRKTTSWPPSPQPWRDKPSGYVYWPRHTFNPAVDDAAHQTGFRAILLDRYKHGDSILVNDEMMALTDLKLKREMVTIWSRGRAMGCGQWGGSQRPADIPMHAYSQAVHLFIGRDTDRRAQQRYDEIGGVDPGIVRAIIPTLPLHHWLYIRRRESVVLCTIGE